jgi:hypothetical protein
MDIKKLEISDFLLHDTHTHIYPLPTINTVKYSGVLFHRRDLIRRVILYVVYSNLKEVCCFCKLRSTRADFWINMISKL